MKVKITYEKIVTEEFEVDDRVSQLGQLSYLEEEAILKSINNQMTEYLGTADFCVHEIVDTATGEMYFEDY
jgi:thermostable 8-oxoguanine DNA glycosylase